MTNLPGTGSSSKLMVCLLTLCKGRAGLCGKLSSALAVGGGSRLGPSSRLLLLAGGLAYSQALFVSSNSAKRERPQERRIYFVKKFNFTTHPDKQLSMA